ncbi:MAG: DUF1501 domain-containing protein [Pseudomonadota bacterium]
MASLDRRQLLAGVGAAGMAAALGGPIARAADTSGYKALVCVFLFGGMDHADTILPMDAASFDLLAAARDGMFNAYGVGSGTSSRDRLNLLPLSPLNAGALGGREYGLPSQLAPLLSLFDAGELAVVGSVGPLIEPTTRTTFEDGTARVPAQLFSHNDQQSAWQTFGAEGSTFGWGGRFVDAALQSDPAADPRFAAISTNGNAAFLSGATSTAFNVSPNGAVGVDVVNRRGQLGGGADFDATRAAMFDYFARANFGVDNIFQRDFAALQSAGIVSGAEFTTAFENASVTTPFPATGIGGQLRAIAETISVRNALGVSRQVFFAGLGGFDTHSNQTNQLPNLHTQFADAVAAFRDAMIELGAWNDVTIFSAADFGRTLNDNGDGTDHGWAGHHFVAGGSVAGRRVFGALPTSDQGTEEYTANRGRLIPTVSVDQYAATLGAWFGLEDAELDAALPNLGNFAARDIGFMR